MSSLNQFQAQELKMSEMRETKGGFVIFLLLKYYPWGTPELREYNKALTHFD